MALSNDVLETAATLPPAGLGTAGAIHLASALAIRRDLVSFVAYDKPLLEAAREAGLPVDSPGLAPPAPTSSTQRAECAFGQA